MAQDVIAIICDCDGTLCPDTTNTLVADLGIDTRAFWSQEVTPLVQAGWDPPLAYLSKLLAVSQYRSMEPLTRSKLQDVGRSVGFYPGVPDFVQRLRNQLAQKLEIVEAGVTIEWYVVSSGIEEVIRSSPLGELATDIFGCSFDFDQAGTAVAVKRTVTFTEKTKFIFAINKGISGDSLRRDPYRVNDTMNPIDRRVPFENMVYIGDGPSDIPCFSMIKRFDGHAIGVWPPEDIDMRRPYELAEGQRLTMGPYAADYRDGSDLFKMLSTIVAGIASSILEKREQRVRPAPGH